MGLEGIDSFEWICRCLGGRIGGFRRQSVVAMLSVSGLCEREMEKKGREMVRRCGGLPLAIVVLGGLLANRRTLKEWDMVHQSMDVYLRKGKGIGQQEGTVQDVLALSYNDLPYQLKPCFLYLGNFPEDHNIGAETLCLLWMAECLISSEDQGEGETMMDVAERYIGELAQRSMIQVKLVTDDSWWSTVKRFESFRLHDLMRDLCLSKGKTEDFLKVLDFRSRRNESSSVVGISRARRLAVFVNKDTDGSIGNVQEETTKARSLLFLNPNGGWQSLRWPPEIPDLKEFRFLRVLNLDGFDFSDKKILKGIGKLIHLRYLGFKNCHLKELPSSIGKLRYLQTLDLQPFDEIMIPNVLWKIDQFKHLYLPENLCVEDDEKLRLEGLSKLETLRNFDPSTCNVEDLVKLTSLRNFGAFVTRNLEDVQEIINYLNFVSEQLRLATLVVKTSDFCSNTGISIIHQLFGCQALHFLGLEGRMGRLPEYGSYHFSSSITRINMCMSQLEEDPLATLEKLPNLRGLILYMDAYLGTEMVCSARGFPQLRNLRFWYLHSLKKWRIEEGAMPNLLSLEINNCRDLEMIPDGMRFLTTLQKLNIYDMPESFRDRVRVIDGKEGEDFDKVRHVPSITFSIF